MKLEKRLAYLGTVGNNAPFIGLLGTVIGILAAFDELSKGTLAEVAGSSQVANQQMANQALMGRISEALVATAIGILIAIPAVAAFNAFQRIVRGTLANTEALGHLLLAHLKAIPLPAGEATADADEAKAERSSARKDQSEDSERN
jgi:biopolymer transport protein ExbB